MIIPEMHLIFDRIFDLIFTEAPRPPEAPEAEAKAASKALPPRVSAPRKAAGSAGASRASVAASIFFRSPNIVQI